MLRTLSLLLLAAALLAGCGSMPSRDQAPDSAMQAERDYADGEFQAAAQGFLAAAGDQRSRRDYFRLRAAEAWREEGDLAQARSTVEGVNPRRFDAVEQLRLNLLLAELALDAGQPREAVLRLESPATAVPEVYRERYHYLRATAFEQGTDPFSAATEHALLAKYLAPSEQADNARRIQKLLIKVDDATLSQRSAALPAGHPLYVHAGRVLSSRGLALPRPYDRGAGFGVNAAARPPADVDGYRPYARVALLLPLEGALALAARSVRDGFMTAYYAEARRRPSVRVYDTGGEPDGALEAYRRAVADGAEVVVGPLSRDSVAALFDSNQLSAPLLALNRGGNAPPPPGSASFALAPEDEGIAAAERMLQRGWRRVIAVGGEDESAQRSLAAFHERMALREGEVVATIALPESAPDYAPLIRQALSAAGIQSTASTDADDGSAPPSIRVAADAIFLAAKPAQARLFAPQLRVAGVYDLPIIATSQIAAGGANARLDRELDGVEFTEIPWLISDLPGVPERAALAERLESARGGGARLFAFGLDAFRLLGRLDQLGADPNQRLDGATGSLSLDGFGQVQRTPGWARYSGGRVQPAPDGGLISDGVEYRNP